MVFDLHSVLTPAANRPEGTLQGQKAPLGLSYLWKSRHGRAGRGRRRQPQLRVFREPRTQPVCVQFSSYALRQKGLTDTVQPTPPRWQPPCHRPGCFRTCRGGLSLFSTEFPVQVSKGVPSAVVAVLAVLPWFCSRACATAPVGGGLGRWEREPSRAAAPTSDRAQQDLQLPEELLLPGEQGGVQGQRCWEWKRSWKKRPQEPLSLLHKPKCKTWCFCVSVLAAAGCRLYSPETPRRVPVACGWFLLRRCSQGRGNLFAGHTLALFSRRDAPAFPGTSGFCGKEKSVNRSQCLGTRLCKTGSW